MYCKRWIVGGENILPECFQTCPVEWKQFLSATLVCFCHCNTDCKPIRVVCPSWHSGLLLPFFFNSAYSFQYFIVFFSSIEHMAGSQEWCVLSGTLVCFCHWNTDCEPRVVGSSWHIVLLLPSQLLFEWLPFWHIPPSVGDVLSFSWVLCINLGWTATLACHMPSLRITYDDCASHTTVVRHIQMTANWEKQGFCKSSGIELATCDVPNCPSFSWGCPIV